MPGHPLGEGDGDFDHLSLGEAERIDDGAGCDPVAGKHRVERLAKTRGGVAAPAPATQAALGICRFSATERLGQSDNS